MNLKDTKSFARSSMSRANLLKWLPSHGPDLIGSPEQGSHPSGSVEEFDTFVDTAMTLFRI